MPHAILCVILRSLAEHLLKNLTERGYSLLPARNSRLCATKEKLCDCGHPGKFLLRWSHEAPGSVQSCSATPAQPAIRLGSHSSEIKDVDHDASWLALLRSFADSPHVRRASVVERAGVQMDASLLRHTFPNFRHVY